MQETKSRSTKITKEMQKYANEQMTQLIKNIAVNPVEVYSAKEWGKEKKFYLGKSFVEDIIKRINYYD